MHEQARDLLPALLTVLRIDGEAAPLWLLGHSDGGSIALIFAATFPHRDRGARRRWRPTSSSRTSRSTASGPPAPTY